MIHIDSAVSATILEQLGVFKISALSQFNSILPLAMGIVITVTVVYLAIHWFGKLSGVGK